MLYYCVHMQCNGREVSKMNEVQSTLSLVSELLNNHQSLTRGRVPQASLTAKRNTPSDERLSNHRLDDDVVFNL